MSSTADATVTLVEGAAFCISARTGNIVEGSPMGLFVRDTRILSQFIAEVDGERLEPLTVTSDHPHRAQFVCRVGPRPRRPDSSLLVVREREVSQGLRESVHIRNLGPETCGVLLTLRVAADFADLFEVKLGHLPEKGRTREIDTGDAIELHAEHSGGRHGVRIRVAGEAVPGQATAQALPGILMWHLAIPARAQWSTQVLVDMLIDGQPIPEGTAAPHARDESPATRRAREWRERAPAVRSGDPGLSRTLTRSQDDLGALRIRDPKHADRVMVAAGAPWFMALFGRDSLLTSWMALPIDVALAVGTARALAESQGRRDDPLSEEQPGRILHERRYGRSPFPVRGGDGVYYGSADATPLFVMLVGEMRRWGLAQTEVDALLPHVDRALEWITTYGDRDGDGFVEYQRATDRGLRNQGWKDSSDAVNFADGTLASPPIALCEVQGYAYGAFLARAHFARNAGDTATSHMWAGRARDLRESFNERFWLPKHRWYAVGLDRDKRPIDSLTSNIGHCLWSGIIDEDRVPAVVEHLMSPSMFTGWGVRTLASSMGAYNPMSYHNGSVWPHDNAILVAGLMRYGFVDEALAVATAVLDAAAAFEGRLPEVFCGFDRSEFPQPIPYPTACSPQAWAAAAPILILRSLLRLDPWIPNGEVRIAPVVPPRYLPLAIRNLPLGDSRVNVEVTANTVSIEGMAPSIRLIRQPRPSGTSLEAS